MSCSQDKTLLPETLKKFELVHGIELSEPTVYIPRVKGINNEIAKLTLAPMVSYFTIHLTDEKSKRCVEWIQNNAGEPMEISLIKGSNEIGIVRQLADSTKKHYNSIYLDKNSLSRIYGNDLPVSTEFWYVKGILLYNGRPANAKYYRDGCYAVAHDLYRAFCTELNEPEFNVCGKCAIVGDFGFRVSNCYIGWRYHIVPWFIIDDDEYKNENFVHDRLLFDEEDELHTVAEWLSILNSFCTSSSVNEIRYVPGRYFALDEGDSWLFDDRFVVTDYIMEKYRNKRGCDPID